MTSCLKKIIYFPNIYISIYTYIYANIKQRSSFARIIMGFPGDKHKGFPLTLVSSLCAMGRRALQMGWALINISECHLYRSNILSVNTEMCFYQKAVVQKEIQTLCSISETQHCLCDRQV